MSEDHPQAVGGLILVRHGATSWSESGRHTGRQDLPLNENGRAEALALAPALSAFDLAYVLVSPLQRAVETAELLGVASQAELVPDLMEWNYGAYEGRTSVEIHAERPSWDLFVDGCPQGEGPDDVARRADAVIESIVFEPDAGARALLVAHGHLLRVLAARYLGRDVTLARSLALSSAHLSLLGFEHSTHVIGAWNLGPSGAP